MVGTVYVMQAKRSCYACHTEVQEGISLDTTMFKLKLDSDHCSCITIVGNLCIVPAVCYYMLLFYIGMSICLFPVSRFWLS